MSLPTDQLELAIMLHKFVRPEDVYERQAKLVFPIQGLDFHDVHVALFSMGLGIEKSERNQTVEYQLPASFFLNLEEVLLSCDRRLFSLDRFYLVEGDCYCKYEDEGSYTEQIKNYFVAAKLANALLSIADHQGGIGSEKTIIFLGKDKLEFTIDYTIADLSFDIDLSAFTGTYLDSDIHREQKRTIIKTVLFEMFSGRDVVPILELLCKFNDFVRRIDASYQLYVSEFSFEKVKEQIEKEKLDATTKLNKVFSDIQNQLLAVPAALILAGGQMVQEHVWSTKNISIWLGVVVMSIFMSMLIRNQRNTLQAVTSEIEQQWLQLEGKYHSVAVRFRTSYQQLNGRSRHQEWLIKIISFLVSLSLFITTLLLLYYSVDMPVLIYSFKIGFGVAVFVFVIEQFVLWIMKYMKNDDASN